VERNQKLKPRSRRTARTAVSLGGLLATTAFTGVPLSVKAQTIVTLPPISIENSHAPLTPLSGTTFSGKALTSQLPSATDIPHLLGPVPGLSLQTGGPVSTLPVLNGLADDRVNILVDGMSITSSCGNHMNPPLAYFDPSAVARIQVLPGVTPVSLGGDSIGGTINVEQAPPKFARKSQDVLWDGQLSVYYRSNGNGISTDGALSASTSNMSIGYAGMWGQSEDYKDGNGHKVLSTNYQESNHYITLGFKNIAGGTLVIRGGIQSIPYQGFANQRMDMNGNHSQFVNAKFARDFTWGKLDSTLFYHNVNHYMNFLSDKITSPGTQMPMYTHGRDFG
jgi:iron complex outermembrane receptor protein